MNKLFFIISLLLISRNNFALEFAIDGDIKLEMSVPATWNILEKKMKSPLLIGGPTLPGSNYRPIINFFAVKGVPENELNENFFKETMKEYEVAKKKWIEQKGGELSGLIEFKTINFKNLKKVNSFGSKYSWDQTKFEEISYYVDCNKKYLHLKFLQPIVNEKLKEAVEEEVKTILDSLTCK